MRNKPPAALIRSLGLALGLGCISAAAGWLVPLQTDPPSPPQPDSLLYYQYARSIAGGHPYRFLAADPPSTGSTGHLWPWVLALPYRCGARGTALIAAGGAIGGTCLLAALAAAVLIAHRLDRRAALPAALLCGLSGHLAFTVLGQTDMTLFVPLGLAALAAALYGKSALLAALLAAGAACRPEGALLSGLVVIAGLAMAAAGHARGPEGRRLLAAGLTGLAATGVVLLLNHRLTGQFLPQSLDRKGVFHAYPYPGALWVSAKAFAATSFFTLSGLCADHRAFLMLPAAGGALCCRGLYRLLHRPRPNRLMAALLPASFGAAVATASLSLTPGVAYDRYLGWVMPIPLVLAAVGLARVPLRQWRTGLCALLALYQVAGWCFYGRLYLRMQRRTAASARFAAQAHGELAPGVALGCLRQSGLAYYMPGRVLRNLSGITSPVFHNPVHFVHNVEVLKHAPATRFSHWLASRRDLRQTGLDALGVEPIMEQDNLGSRSWAVLPARWQPLDDARLPRSPAALKSLASLRLADALDIGHLGQQRAHGYTTYRRRPDMKIEPALVSDEYYGARIAEVAQVILGSMTTTLKVDPARPARVVLRLLPSAAARVQRDDGSSLENRFHLATPSELAAEIEGARLPRIAVPFDEWDGPFEEVFFDLPAEHLSAERVKLKLVGDHIACALWVYQ